MDSPPAASLPPQVPDGAIGWFAKSCLTLIIAAVALVIICLFGRWFILTRFADRFTATQPAVVEVQQPTAPELAGSRNKVGRVAHRNQE